MPSKNCIHGKRPCFCREGCGGSAYCEHGHRKTRCREGCGGSELCEHNIHKYRCYDCGGTGICIHNKRLERCEECKILLLCEHNNKKATCKVCKEARTCEHNRTRDKCCFCNPSYYHCQHGITKYLCRDCNGSAYCEHDKYRNRCYKCGGCQACKSGFCEKLGMKKYNGYCLTCCIHFCPEIEVVRNYKTKERTVVERVLETYDQYTWIVDKKIQDGCSRRRPDLLLELGSHIIIVEIDENRHMDYDCSCENKRLMEISQDLGHRPIVFIRFNPDEYEDKDGNEVESCWKLNGLGVVYIPPEKEDEWNSRIDVLLGQIQYWIDNESDKTVEIVELFY